MTIAHHEFDLDDFLAEDPEAELAQRKERRRVSCMMPTRSFDPVTAQWKKGVWRCKQFRECASCMEWRVMQEAAQLQHVLNAHPDLMCTYELPNEAKKFIRQLESPYRRYPVTLNGEEQILIVFHYDDALEYGTPLDGIEPLIFAGHAMETPPGKRVTGGLFVLEEEDPEQIDESFETSVDVPVFILESDVDVTDEDFAREKALEFALRDIKSNQITDLTAMMRTLTDELMRSYKILDIRFHIGYTYTKRVDIRTVDWEGYRPYERQIISMERQNSTRKMTDLSYSEFNELLFE